MNSKKNKMIKLLLCFLACTVFFCACTKQEPEKPKENISDKISQKIDAYTTDLEDTADSIQSNRAILKYLSDWADAKKIEHRRDKAGNLLFTRSATNGYQDTEPTVLICPCDYKQYRQCIPSLATSLYLIKNTEASGKLTIIYTPSAGDRYKALSALDKKLLPENARIITLNPGTKGVFASSTAAGSTYRFTLKGRRTKPTLKTAYEIRLSGLPSGMPDAKIAEVPNPILAMEDVLTWIYNRKNSFEIASFHGGVDSALYAPSASLVITMDANDEEEFLEKMESTAERWTEKYGQKYPDAVYTYQKTNLPRKVYNKETTLSLVSFMYTLLKGEYYRDENNDLISISNISRISTDKKKIRIWSSAYSLSEDNLKEIDNGEMTLANLSGASFTTIHRVPLWTSAEDTEFTQAIKTAYDNTSKKSLTYQPSVAATCTGQVQALTDSRDLLSITVSDNIAKECTATLLEYMTTLNVKEEEE